MLSIWSDHDPISPIRLDLAKEGEKISCLLAFKRSEVTEDLVVASKETKKPYHWPSRHLQQITKLKRNFMNDQKNIYEDNIDERWWRASEKSYKQALMYGKWKYVGGMDFIYS